MALIDVNIEDRHEEITLQDMAEVVVRIVVVPEIKDSAKTGGKFLQLRLEVEGEPYAKEIYHVIMFPAPGDSEKKVNSRRNALADFYSAFGIDPQNAETEEMVGLTASAILKETDDEEYGLKNSVRRWNN